MGMFGTRLSDKDEKAYQLWRSKLAPNLQNEGDYDLRGAFKGNAQEAANGHLPDTYKLPNHITFSTGSMYSTPENMGGEWVDSGPNAWSFWASPTNVRNAGAQGLWDYFKRYEPDSTLILPDFGFRLARN